MRLGYLVSQYPATNHTFILREIRTLRRLGFSIEVVSIRAPDRPRAAMSREEADELQYTRCVLASGVATIAGAHASTLLRSPLRYFRGLFAACRLSRWDLPRAARLLAYFTEAVVAGAFLMKQNVRHAHTHFSSTVALLMAEIFPIRFSMTIHGPDEFNDVVGFDMAEKLAKCAFVAVISRFAASQTMKASAPQHWDKIHILPLGVDPAEFSARAPQTPGQIFRILSVGRLAPAKAHQVLIAAIGRLIELGRDNVRLTIVGEGPARAGLETIIARQNLGAYVQLAGSCNHDKVLEFYSETDVFALASFAEGVPVVLMEAMAMEVPCVATWITGIPELIHDQVDGLLVPPADPVALADAIVRLMDDRDLCSRLGAAARLRVLSNYDLARNTEKLGRIFSGETAAISDRS